MEVGVVSAPILLKTPLFATTISPNFGTYVLAKDRDAFWKDRELVGEVQDNLKRLGFDSWYNEAVVSGESFEYTRADTKRAKISNDRVRMLVLARVLVQVRGWAIVFNGSVVSQRTSLSRVPPQSTAPVPLSVPSQPSMYPSAHSTRVLLDNRISNIR